MADEILQFACTIPAGTLKSAPVTIPMAMTLYDVESVDVEVPSGPAGLMGFYLAIGAEPWIPHAQNSWIVWDNQSKNWPLSNQPTSYGWNLVGYNTGKYNHTITVRFHVTSVSPSPSAPPASITIISQPLAMVSTL